MKPLQIPPKPSPSFFKKVPNKVIELLSLPLLYSPSFFKHPNRQLKQRWAKVQPSKALHQQTQKCKLKSFLRFPKKRKNNIYLCFRETITRDTKSNFSAFVVFSFSILVLVSDFWLIHCLLVVFHKQHNWNNFKSTKQKPNEFLHHQQWTLIGLQLCHLSHHPKSHFLSVTSFFGLCSWLSILLLEIPFFFLFFSFVIHCLS